MSMLKDAITIYQREMLIFKANIRTNLIRSIIFPVVIILFFGSIGATLARGVPIAIVNYATNAKANNFISTLSSSPTQIDVKAITDQNTALSMLKSGTVALVVVILPGFPSGSNNNAVSSSLLHKQLFIARNSLSFVSSEAGQYSAKTTLSPISEAEHLNAPAGSSPTHETVSYNLISGIQSGYTSFIATGVIGMVVIFGAVFGGGMSMITDRQLGNLKAFIISPINKDSIVLGKMMAGTLQSVIYGMVAVGIVLLDGVTIALGAVGNLLDSSSNIPNLDRFQRGHHNTFIKDKQGRGIRDTRAGHKPSPLVHIRRAHPSKRAAELDCSAQRHRSAHIHE